MLKVYSKKSISLILAISLAFTLGTGVMAKGPAKDPAPNSNPVVQEDGRNTNGLGTARISFEPITGYYGTTEVISGEVVIDGARDDLANLYITIGGQNVDSVWAVPGKSKTYGFTATVALTSHDLTSIELIAETKFHNGQKAGKVHSNNSSSVDVEVIPVITSYTVNFGTNDACPNFIWDPETETYSTSFTVIKTLSNGETEEIEIPLSNLAPNTAISFSSDDLADANYFGDTVVLLDCDVPVAPIPTPPIPEDVTITHIIVNDLRLESNPSGNQFKVIADYTIYYSNNTTLVITNQTLAGGNISNPVTVNQNSSTREYTIGGIQHIVTVTYANGIFSASAVKK